MQDDATLNITLSPVDRIERIRAALVPQPQTIAIPAIEYLVCRGDVAFKDDGATMEVPIFSLSTREDLQIWRYVSEDGKKTVEVAPSVYGRATQHDKDVLIYCTSHLVAAFNRGETPGKTVRFTVYDFLKTTRRNTRGDDYKRFEITLDRMKGTQIKSTIKTSRERRIRGFGLIDSWGIIEKSPTDGRMIAVEVTVSDWTYDAIYARDVLTLNPSYFDLRKPLERRLYEIARKHVGRQGMWEIGLEALRRKCGSTQKVLRRFKHDLEEIIEADTLPDYRFMLHGNDKVVFYSRDADEVSRRLLAQKRGTPGCG